MGCRSTRPAAVGPGRSLHLRLGSARPWLQQAFEAALRVLERDLGLAVGVLVTPTLCMTAQHPDGRMLGSNLPGTPADAVHPALQSITGHPAISVPPGRLPGGLPFGLQLTGPRDDDDLLLDLAARWEQEQPWPWFTPGFGGFSPAALTVQVPAPPTGARTG